YQLRAFIPACSGHLWDICCFWRHSFNHLQRIAVRLTAILLRICLCRQHEGCPPLQGTRGLRGGKGGGMRRTATPSRSNTALAPKTKMEGSNPPYPSWVTHVTDRPVLYVTRARTRVTEIWGQPVTSVTLRHPTATRARKKPACHEPVAIGQTRASASSLKKPSASYFAPRSPRTTCSSFQTKLKQRWNSVYPRHSTPQSS